MCVFYFFSLQHSWVRSLPNANRNYGRSVSFGYSEQRKLRQNQDHDTIFIPFIVERQFFYFYTVIIVLKK